MTPVKIKDYDVLFRGKRLEDRYWVFGLPHIKDGRLCIQRYRPQWNSYVSEPILPDTLCRNTGLRDSKGFQIFEGDILTVKEDSGEINDYTVVWRGEDNYPAFDVKPALDIYANGLSYLLDTCIEIEITGNIFQDGKEPREENRWK